MVRKYLLDEDDYEDEAPEEQTLEDIIRLETVKQRGKMEADAELYRTFRERELRDAGYGPDTIKQRMANEESANEAMAWFDEIDDPKLHSPLIQAAQQYEFEQHREGLARIRAAEAEGWAGTLAAVAEAEAGIAKALAFSVEDDDGTP